MKYMTWTINLLKTHKAATLMTLLLITALPLTLFQLNKIQETRSRASGGAIAIVLAPLTQTSNIGTGFSIEVNLNTGGNDVSAVDVTFTYDSDLLGSSATTIPLFTPSSTFSQIVLNAETPGSIHYVGVNPTSTSINGSLINIGTLQFKGKAAGTASVGFSNIHINGAGVAGALPVDATNTKIGTYTITQGSTLSPTVTTTPSVTIPVPSPSPTPLPTASPTPMVTSTPAPTATPAPGANISLNLRLPGIGSGSGSNTAPKRATRTAKVTLFDASGKPVVDTVVGLSYANGIYTGLVPMGTLAAGSYEVKVKLDNTLWKRIPGILVVSSGTQVFAPATLDLIPGDISGTNLIDLSDYNAVLACYAGTCAANIMTLADFNDDGTVDAKDLNILLRAFANRQGD